MHERAGALRAINYKRVKSIVKGLKHTLKLLCEAEQRAVDRYKPMLDEVNTLRAKNRDLEEQVRGLQEKLARYDQAVAMFRQDPAAGDENQHH